MSNTGTVRVAGIYIDCPRENCGGGVTADGWNFYLTKDALPELYGSKNVCGVCMEPIRIPVAAFNLLTKGHR